ncbi:unnamed protein product [Diatraea saccharalis]|uniref:Uncharacterized protein n=1 Tax=Diatraea saccharalis TaxID=40085 RepID=A0A9N9WD02_9NEOP|nr:unnamed protein product [Diatraea saccharalis]
MVIPLIKITSFLCLDYSVLYVIIDIPLLQNAFLNCYFFGPYGRILCLYWFNQRNHNDLIFFYLQRLFANRDYVYIRRHKDFDVTGSVPLPHKEGLFESPPSVNHPPVEEERPSVHSHAKRKAIENDLRQKVNGGALENKVFVIISRSCEHPEVPESKNAIRVSEYWSHMVVKSLNGVDKPGMEFVLTYYDEPAVGGLPSGVAAWATGRAAPAYLERMRRAAHDYDKWRSVRSNQELPDFVSFNQSKTKPSPGFKVSEQDMESSKDGPELENAGAEQKRDQSTQTEQIQSIDNNAAIDKTVVVIVQVRFDVLFVCLFI